MYKKTKKESVRSCFENHIYKSNKVEYSTGTKFYYRGVYSPTVIEDYIVKNAKRGKIIKGKPQGEDYYSYYWHDEKLIGTHKKCLNRDYYEFITNHGGVEYCCVEESNADNRQLSKIQKNDSKVVISHFSYHPGLKDIPVHLDFEFSSVVKERIESYHISNGLLFIKTGNLYGTLKHIVLSSNNEVQNVILSNVNSCTLDWRRLYNA